MGLRVKLGAGFRDDTVSVRVDGVQVFDKSGITTDLRISRAEVVEVPAVRPVVQLEVSVAGGPSAAREIKPQETPFVEVRVVDGELELRATNEETPML